MLLVADEPAQPGSAVDSGTVGATSADPAREAERLRAAIDASVEDLEILARQCGPVAGADVADILEAQALLARDPAIVEPALAAVASGTPPAPAVLDAAKAAADQLSALADPVFAARAADVLDVGRRIAARLEGRPLAGSWHADGSPAVIVAQDLAPSDTATLRPELVAGIALSGGTITGHAAIVARALELPLVLGLGPAVLALAPRSRVLVDGSGGRVILDPTDADTATPRPG